MLVILIGQLLLLFRILLMLLLLLDFALQTMLLGEKKKILKDPHWLTMQKYIN